jgi:hypothetical protein
MKKTALTALLVIALLTPALSKPLFFPPAAAAPQNPVQLSMPIEHINYTITEINGVFWAKIDGNYPINVQGLTGGLLPMVYPLPPNATNIHIYLNGNEQPWENVTAVYPELTHKTAIGDWQMVSALLENLSDSFVLSIHYEHPLEKVNSSYLFLYDLNIVDYLSLEQPSSTAYFNVLFEFNISSVNVYTAPPDSTPEQWCPKEFTETTDGSVTAILVEMHSQYGASLRGDLVVVISNKVDTIDQKAMLPSLFVIVVLCVFFLAILIYAKRRTLASKISSKKTAK